MRLCYDYHYSFKNTLPLNIRILYFISDLVQLLCLGSSELFISIPVSSLGQHLAHCHKKKKKVCPILTMCQKPAQKAFDPHSLFPSLQRRLRCPIAGSHCNDNSVIMNNNCHRLSVFPYGRHWTGLFADILN